MQKVIIIEDDPAIREELALLLGNEGYQVLLITDFREIPSQVMDTGADLILLDIGLPGRDGFALCGDLHRLSAAPIIFVTSRSSTMDELQALSLGGDDYITKPYHIPVLLARIKAVLRRCGAAGTDTLEVDGLRLDLAKGVVSAGAQTAELTRNEIKILAYLMGRPGEIVSRTDLIEALWDSQIYIDDNSLSVNMTRLRAKLGALGLPDRIRTRRGMGYQL